MWLHFPPYRMFYISGEGEVLRRSIHAKKLAPTCMNSSIIETLQQPANPILCAAASPKAPCHTSGSTHRRASRSILHSSSRFTSLDEAPLFRITRFVTDGAFPPYSSSSRFPFPIDCLKDGEAASLQLQFVQMTSPSCLATKNWPYRRHNVR